ncbi:hypothetical protein NDU88_005965 [Pleurodeles waltl]|uniref:Uncharacterized protein n=1 Tax=Pleurodeles waltl TaxID=8319 RepID=A0AAV7X293_PLEWA|nr:hypothetical protein NDU88_005965 [Pleurodeles waltl]
MGTCADGDSDAFPCNNAILMELCAGFRAINTRFDTMASHLDRMGKRLDRHNMRMAHSEDRISKVEDTTSKMGKRLEVLKTGLCTVGIKNEDLEARGRHNNLCILKVAKLTNMGHAKEKYYIDRNKLTYLINKQVPGNTRDGKRVLALRRKEYRHLLDLEMKGPLEWNMKEKLKPI